jgi:AAA domain
MGPLNAEVTMPKLSDHQSSKFTKLMYLGDSGTGKTGSMASLVAAGYKVRVLDLDNGLDALKTYVHETCPEKIGNVDYKTIRDPIRAGLTAPVITPKAFVEGTKLMGKWEDDSVPGEWGPDTIFVVDSLSAYGRAAYAWARGLNPAAKDPRQWYHAAQQGVEDTINLLTAESFATNVIVITHINYKEVVENETKGYANSIGTALGPILPRYFNTVIAAEKLVQGKTVRRTIRVVPTTTVDLKTPMAPSVLGEGIFPLESGLATIFEKLRA